MPSEVVDINEVVKLAATDSDLYSRFFFPTTVRQSSPPQHKDIWKNLEDPTKRMVAFECFRGSAKTTILRLFTSKRIAYSISRTILYIGASEDHAARSVQWIKRRIERNKLWTGAYGLRQGSKWTETSIEIIHGLDQDHPIWLLGVGYTGNLRGINFDDYRPDLIVLDDVITDENAATLEQRDKLSKLIHGAVKESLTPATEEPNAKLAALQTPIHPEDAAAEMRSDPEWNHYRFSCWTPETEDLPLDFQKSSWEERFPTETLRKNKEGAAARNRLSIFLREMECKMITPELATFRPEWLMLETQMPDPKTCFSVLVIDPVPPPSPLQMSKGLVGKDSEAHAVVGRKNGEYYVLDIRASKGHEPNWTVATAIELAFRYRITKIILLAVGYETVLESMLRKEMARKKIYWAIEIQAPQGKSKFARIINQLQGPASQRKVHVHPSQTTFLSQFAQYGPTYTGHDDELEVVAAGVDAVANPYLEITDEDYSVRGEDESKFQFPRNAP